MRLADGLVPSAPNIYPIYRGFYVLPADDMPASTTQVNFFVSRSTDEVQWETPNFIGYGTNTTGFFFAHTGLDEATYYSYRVQYLLIDGSVTVEGELESAGQAQLIASSDLNVDQLASRAYSTGLITSGIFRGVIFQTSVGYPRVQMDPTGLWARLFEGATPQFFLDATSGNATFAGTMTGGSININDTFIVDSLGDMTASDAHIIGDISASTVTGSLVSGTEIKGGDIFGTSINVNDKFIVDSSGAMTSTAANIIGNINASTVTGSIISGGTFIGETFIGSTFIGGVVESSATNPKTALDSSGLYVTNGSGTKIITLDHTDGVALTPGSGATNKISWGSIGGSITGSIEMVFNTQMDVTVNSSPGAGTHSGLRITGGTAATSGPSVTAYTQGQDVVIINDVAESSFLQLGFGADSRAIIWGTDSLAFGGSAIASVTVSFSIPRTPVMINLTVKDIFANITVQASSWGTTGFVLSGVSAPGVGIGSTVSVGWEVIY